MTRPPSPWHVPVRAQDIPEAGLQFSLAADPATRAAVASLLELPDLPRFGAQFEVTPARGGGLHVTGSVSATVGQTCVVTLDPITSEIEERVDLTFWPFGTAPERATAESGTEDAVDELDPNGALDLGTVAVEFLSLGIDPYPRKPEVVFTAPAVGGKDDHPFAGLAALQGNPERGS